MAKILLIEDEELVAGTLEILLRKAGHVVTSASDGAVGLARLAAELPDLVITDIVMPEKEGIETIREIRTTHRDLPIIAYSGGGRTKNYDFLRMAAKLGATEVLMKPFANEQLLAAVHRCLPAPAAVT
jgi:DNA-binding response OmpR family regulator